MEFVCHCCKTHFNQFITCVFLAVFDAERASDTYVIESKVDLNYRNGGLVYKVRTGGLKRQRVISQGAIHV